LRVVAQRLRLREFEQAPLLRGDDVLDAARDAVRAVGGALAQERLGGGGARAVLEQADGRQRQERERGEDDEQFCSEGHGCHHVRRVRR